MALYLTVPDPFDAGDPPPTFEAYATIIGFHCDFAQTQMSVALSNNKSRQARIEDKLAVSQLKIIAPKDDILDEDGNVIQKGFATLIEENKPLFDQVATLIYEYVVSVPAVQELDPQPAPPLDD
jgi:hypothetical protein